MATFLLTWNPKTTRLDDNALAVAVATTASGHELNWDWSTGGRRYGIEAGDTGYLVRQIRERGIVARGSFTSTIWEGTHFNDPTRTAMYADIRIDTFLHPDDRLPTETLLHRVPGVPWDTLYSSGVQVNGSDERALADLWTQHVTTVTSGLHPPEEVAPLADYPEGSLKRITVNRYERDPRARAKCLEIHGTVCAVCQFDFAATYGPLGDNFIHVHHVRELASLPAGYKINPAKDLVPVCPNCHAMLHKTTPAMKPQKLRRLLNR